MNNSIRLPLAAALLLSSGITLAGDQLWREQVDIDAVNGDRYDASIRIADDSRARDNALWREQVSGDVYGAGAAGTRVTLSSADRASEWLWREQVDFLDAGADATLRVSGADADSKPRQ
jgi:hypothetical protein